MNNYLNSRFLFSESGAIQDTCFLFKTQFFILFDFVTKVNYHLLRNVLSQLDNRPTSYFH